MSTIDQFRKTFFQECDELLGALELQLSLLDHCDERAEALNAAFRCVHSIKGGAAMFGLRRLIDFAHAFESSLDAIRKWDAAIEGEVVEKLLRSADVLSDLAEAARTDVELAPDYERACLHDLAHIAASGDRAAPPAPTPAEQKIGTPARAAALYRIQFTPGADLLRRGGEPMALIRNLSGLGTLKTLSDASGLPHLEALDPASIYLSWTFELETDREISEIRSVFDFVAGGATIEIAPIGTEEDVPPAASPVAEQATPADETAPAPRPRPAPRSSSIRIDLDRVERLVDLIGEVTIAQAMVLQHLDKSEIDSNPLLFRALTQLQQLTRGLQDGVMSIRAQPIRTIFSRMPRVARDVAQVTDKHVNLEMSGEETEIDKTIVEQLVDPLIHIVRNAIDHGIEPPDIRRRNGKPVAGTVRLSAAQKGGRIIIEVSDDGGGIDREAVVARAIERNLIAADAVLSEEEADNLIFLPGLSTAETVSGISGRGVGMDIVRRNIVSIGGRISIRSEKGVGTTTTIALPLTLAVLDGMLVRAAAESYIIPLSNVAECFVTARHNLIALAGTGEIIGIRGRHIRTVHLASRLGFSEARMSDLLQVVVVETESGDSVGVIVDEIRGNQQIVVKSIRGACGDLKGISGATILGDGSIALILDVSQLAVSEIDPSAPSRPLNSSLSRPGTFAA